MFNTLGFFYLGKNVDESKFHHFDKKRKKSNRKKECKEFTF